MSTPTEQLAPFAVLRALATRQAEAANDADLERLAQLSAQRDSLAPKLVTPADPAAHAAALKLLHDVVRLDERIQETLSASRDAVRAELGQLGAGRRAVKAYLTPARGQLNTATA